MNLKNRYINKFTISIFILIILAVIAVYIENQKSPEIATPPDINRDICFFKLPNSILGVGTNPDLGYFYTDGSCRTLYAYENDDLNESSCYDECTETWIPYTESVRVNANLIIPGTEDITDEVSERAATIDRLDGTIQYVVDGKPLYYYRGDNIKGDINGHGLNDNNWSVIFTEPVDYTIQQ